MEPIRETTSKTNIFKSSVVGFELAKFGCTVGKSSAGANKIISYEKKDTHSIQISWEGNNPLKKLYYTEKM